jgi:lysophospholipase L1-like esterase
MGSLGVVMHRKLAKAVVQLSIVALISTSVGIANAQTVKVACVGDSITALPSSWCGTLSTELGSGYDVQNFGVSGTNLAKDVSQPYWDSAQYEPSHDFAPNIVIIMLGTNDSFTFSWSSAESHFVADYEELLDTYTMLASKPKPYIIIPTPIGTSPFGHDGNLLATEVIPLIQQVAMTKMVSTIDGFNLFGGAMFDESLFSASDQVHPNAQGQEKLGKEVYRVLMETGALGGSAGSGATAGTGASAGAGAAGSGGMAATAGTMAAGTGATAGGGAGSVSAGGAGGSTSAGSAGTVATPPTAGSRASAAGSTTAPSAAGSLATAGNTASTANPVGAAGSGTVVPPAASSDDGGCRTTGSPTGDGGSTAAFVLLLGLALRSLKRNALVAAAMRDAERPRIDQVAKSGRRAS